MEEWSLRWYASAELVPGSLGADSTVEFVGSVSDDGNIGEKGYLESVLVGVYSMIAVYSVERVSVAEFTGLSSSEGKSDTYSMETDGVLGPDKEGFDNWSLDGLVDMNSIEVYLEKASGEGTDSSVFDNFGNLLDTEEGKSKSNSEL